MYSASILLAGEIEISFEQLTAAATELANNFESRLASVDADRQRIQLTWGDWNCYLTLNTKSYVLAESAEMAERFGTDRGDATRIATCKSRIEVSSDDDPPMDHFNDYIFTLEAIAQFPGAVIFENASGKFI